MNVGGSSNKKRKYEEISNSPVNKDELFLNGEGQEKKRASAQTVQDANGENNNQEDCDKEKFNQVNMAGRSKKSMSHYQT